MLSPRYLVVLATVMAFPCLAHGQGTPVVEHEPNDAVSTATRIAMGDGFSGQINPVNDLDYFAIDVTAGTELVIDGRTDPYLGIGLVDVDGKTMLAWLAANYAYNPPLRYPVTVSGRYFIIVSRSDGTVPYSLRASGIPFRLGPGDPASTIAEIDPYLPARTVVASRTGDWFFLGGNTVTRIGASGQETPFVTGHSVDGGLAFDGFGNLLVPADGDKIWSFAPDGSESLFYEFEDPYTMYGPSNIAVGPDGDVWVAEFGVKCDEARNQCPSVWNLWRFNPLGRLKDTVDLSVVRFDGGYGVRWMGFSPAGELHFTTIAGIYRLTNNQPQLVFPIDLSPGSDPYVEAGALSFDRDGYIYVAVRGRILTLDGTYRVVQDTVAHVPDFTGGLVFARDQSGVTTARLVVGRASKLAELNSAGVRAAGWSVGRQGPFTEAQVQAGLLRRGMVNKPYADTLRVLAAAGPVTWSVSSGTLPPGVTLNGATGIVTGVPTESGTFSFEARATTSQTVIGRFSGTIVPYRLAAPLYRIAEALMGGSALSPDDTQYLDTHGNRNGILDIGDLRAYLRSLGYLAGSNVP